MSQIKHPYGIKRSYHACSKDWITNEIFRRIEPQGRTMGEYYREEIQKKIDADVYFSLRDDELHKVQPIKHHSFVE